MFMNKIGIKQCNNQYELYVAPNVPICQLILPADHQYVHDSKALEIITKALAERWGLTGSKTNRNS